MRADGCISYAYDNGTVTSTALWPNWLKTPVASYDIDICQCALVGESFTGLTLVNFGTATKTDFAGVYAKFSCGATATALLPLTYAGAYAEQTGTYNAWTWAGATLDFGGCTPPCVGCDQIVTMDIIVDTASCPADQATVTFGLAEANALRYLPTGYPSSLADNHGCGEGWGDLTSATQTINYILKSGPPFAAPGDTITYTVTYGRPGAAALAGIVITDTLPPYMHYVPATASPAADAGWDPDPGPPLRLRWSLPGGPVTGGATSELTFQASVDWGNGELFEPGSGDLAAPENLRLDNRAAVNWLGSTCPSTQLFSAPARTSVRRFLFWMIGDNDLLFAGRLGLPDDEMTYSIFVKNTSTTKAWWNTVLWDTVPPELDPWSANEGFDDPCTGWTMTPSGCAAATPGRTVAGGTTILTWKMDMPPGMTLELRWKGRVRLSATAGATATNRISLLELGRTGVVGGTGPSVQPREFVHDALIVLRTTYFSYGAYGYQCTESTNPAGQAFHIHFFPLNKMTNFSFYKQEHSNDVYANTGGISPSIATFAGTCVGGFADGGWSGCKVERAPAAYWPVAYDNTFMIGGIYPSHFLYKVVSNAPFIWELATNSEDSSADRFGWVSGSSLTFASRIHYAFLQETYTGAPPSDYFYVLNTDDTKPTTEFLFRWNPTTLSWDFMDNAELDPGAIWQNTTAISYNQSTPVYNWTEQNYRLISSTTNCMVHRALWANGNFTLGIMSPERENGLLASAVGTPGTFYCNPLKEGNAGGNCNLAVFNLGPLACSYSISLYVPVGLESSPNPTGAWTVVANNSVPAGIATPGNPDRYGPSYIAGVMPTVFTRAVQNFIRVNQVTPGTALEVEAGSDLSGSWTCGTILHDIKAQKSGTEFWLPQSGSNQFNAGKACLGTNPTNLYTIDVFCPATGMAPQLRSYQSQAGYNATYTTTAPDQVVSFRGLSNLGAVGTRNWQILVGGVIQDAVVQTIAAEISEKYYTLPFVSQGTFYIVIAPPVAFTGQSFWITVVVATQTGNTKTDYCGTSSFTSTDATAKIENTAMDTYNFTWQSSIAGGCNGGAAMNGVRIFLNVTMTQLGLQTLVVGDTTDGSITGLTTIMVVGADVKLTKEPRLSVAASGDTVQFRVCWSNYSSSSAFTFVITDAVPEGTAFVPEAGTGALSCGNTTGLPLAVAFSTATSATAPPAASFAAGNPSAGTRWLRWTVPYAGVNTTGCACFRVSVN